MADPTRHGHLQHSECSLDPQAVLRRAHAEVEAGRRWRAREIVGGALSIPRVALDPEVLEFYGQLLASADEQYAAGLYFFLSGSRRPEYEEAIALFLRRTRMQHGTAMLNLFPNAVRRYGAGHLPENVRGELERRGLTATQLSLRADLRQPPPTPPGNWRDTVTVYIIFAVFCFLALALLTGLLTIARTIFSPLRG